VLILFDINVCRIKYWLLNSWESRTSCYKCCHFNVLLSPRPLSAQNDSQVRDHSFCIASICASCNTSIGGQRPLQNVDVSEPLQRMWTFSFINNSGNITWISTRHPQKMPLFALMHIYAESMHIYGHKVMPYCSCSSCHVPTQHLGHPAILGTSDATNWHIVANSDSFYMFFCFVVGVDPSDWGS